MITVVSIQIHGSSTGVSYYLFNNASTPFNYGLGKLQVLNVFIKYFS